MRSSNGDPPATLWSVVHGVDVFLTGGGGARFTMVLEAKQSFSGPPPEAIGAVRATRPNDTGSALGREIIIV